MATYNDIKKIKIGSDVFNLYDSGNSGGTITSVKTTAGAHTTVNTTSGAASFNVPTKTSHLTNDSGFITGYTETDPTVPSWAKASTKPSYAASEISGLLDFFYPVGSYYETSNTSFDPNTSWGGTWELEDEGLVHIGAGTNYTAGNTGGEATHTLTTDEMPSHTHTQNSHNHTQEAHTHTQNSHNHTQNSHNHTQNSHNHTQNGHTHPIPVNTGYHPSSGGGGSAGDNAWAVDATYTPTINSKSTTATNIATTATNIATTATNIATTATNQNTTAVNKAATATNQNTGGGGAHNNMQPYVVVNRWHRTA